MAIETNSGDCVVGATAPHEEILSEDLQNILVHLPLEERAPIPAWEVAVKTAFFLVAFLLDLVGNAIVIMIIALNKKMQTTTNLFILNLACADVLVGSVCMWILLGNNVNVYWPFGPFVCKMGTFAQVVAVTTSILTLTLISMERFVAILFPQRKKIGHKLALILNSITWLIAMGMASPYVIVKEEIVYKYKDGEERFCEELWPRYYADDTCTAYDQPEQKIYYALGVVVMYVIPVLVMIVAYTSIAVKVLKRKVPGGSDPRSLFHERHIQRRKKVLKMLVAMVVSFIVCWTPQQCLLLWDTYRSEDDKPPESMPALKYAAIYIAYFNSAINPILYAGFNDSFREGFKDAFQCRLCRKHNKVANDSIVPLRSVMETSKARNSTEHTT